MERKVTTIKDLALSLDGNYIQIIKRNGKVHDKLYRDPQRAIRAVGGPSNIKYLREVLKEQVNVKYTSIDAITDTPEETL